MQGKRFSCLGLLLLSTVGLLALFSGSAAAAGAPSLAGSSLEATPLSAATLEFKSIKVNPNGAETEVRTEYGDASSTHVTPWKKAGSGTTSVTVPQVVGVNPYDTIWLKVEAKNSYGSAKMETSEYLTPVWLIEHKGNITSAFETEGTFKLEFTASVILGKIECNAVGSGMLGHKAAEGDYYNVSLSGCSYYQNGKFICHPKEPIFQPKFDGAFLALSGTETMKFQYCPGEETTSTLSTGPYGLTVNASHLTVHTMTLKASGTINGGWPATVTISGNMFLSGEHAGQKFAWFALEG